MKILMVLTSHDQLGDTGKKTGFWLEEFAAPYYAFKDAGADVTLVAGPVSLPTPPGVTRIDVRRADTGQVVHSVAPETNGFLRGTMRGLARERKRMGVGPELPFDLIGRAYTHHHLPLRQVLPVTFVCYAFGLNLGAWIGSIGLRFRLYSQLGLRPSVITKVLTLSLMTNWLGYSGLLGVVLAFGLIVPPAGWELGIPGLRLLGGGLLVLLLGYLLLCAFSRRRYWTIRGHEIYLPSLGMGLLQVALGASNWALMALVLNILLPAQLGYPAVLGALLVSAFAGVITHIPAGLGVMEVVFIALLQQQTSIGVLLAGLIGYRVVYYLLPLALAGLGYALLEMRAKRMRRSNRRKQATLDKP